MAKKKVVTVVSKCACSICGQVASVVAGGEHNYCLGFSQAFFAKAPSLKGRLRGPTKGVWVPV